MKNVTKQIFLNSVACSSLGWLMRSGSPELFEAALSPGEVFRIEQGNEIGLRARNLYPGGKLVFSLNPVLAAEETLKLLEDEKVQVIFEAAFVTGGYAARADILRRTEGGWHLYEVKSGVNEKDELLDDIAYTAMVLGRCGLEITGSSLLLVSKDYRLGMNDEALFREVDTSDDTKSRAAEFDESFGRIEEVTRSETKPEPTLIYECRGCELFEDCVGKAINNHIFQLPRLGESRFTKLTEEGINRIEYIPDGFSLTENQQRVRDCVVSEQIYVGDNLKNELDSIVWPAYYLDFETVMTAIPLYPDTAPYTQIPTQYSIHKLDSLDAEPEHFEYLAEPERDCRRDLAERLIKDLGNAGSIVVYSGFEKTVIGGLAALFPELAEALNSLTERLFDLEAVIRKNFYHPGFHGSTSIKKTLPVLVPEMSYEGMAIGDGDTAMAEFAWLAQSRHSPDVAAEKKQQLLEYCCQDTLAMVELNRKLVGYANERS